MTELTANAQALREQLIRNVNQVPLTRDQRAPLYDTQCASLLRGCPYHFHYTQEELFIILEGHGTLRVAGEHIPIQAGDVITTPAGPQYPHQIINTSAAPLKYLSVSTKEYPEITEYPDSGKYMAYDRRSAGPLLQGGKIHRADSDLDYWQGEP
jgi:uncharacterized cupin superfamily protein